MPLTALARARPAEPRPAPDRAPGGELAHRPQLDALRAFAIAGVLYAHFGPQPLLFDQAGNPGVRLFFVLSGFLITWILLRARDDAPTAGGVGRQWRVFYARRALRIFPVYYATLAVITLAGVSNVRHEIGWHLLYLSNVYAEHIGRLPRWTGPFWSLSVEEQFYLVWPALVLLLPRRLLGAVMIATVPLGVLARWALPSLGFSEISRWTLTPAMLDSLGMGAVLAWSQWHSGLGPGVVPRWLRVGVVLAVVAFTLLKVNPLHMRHAWLLVDTCAAVVFAWLVARAAGGWTGPVGAVLAWRPLTYLGQISYGIYLFHMFVMYAWWRFFRYFGIRYPGVAASAALYTLSTVVLAALSWHFFERPINGLKRFFPYRRPASSAGRRTPEARPSDSGWAAPAPAPMAAAPPRDVG
jgi:peptidoglycan/LPS O-acetylase OafA/YrhL